MGNKTSAAIAASVQPGGPFLMWYAFALDVVARAIRVLPWVALLGAMGLAYFWAGAGTSQEAVRRLLDLISSQASRFADPRVLIFGVILPAAGYLFARYRQRAKDLKARRPLWAEAVWDARHGGFSSLVLGLGGSGKTTLLQYLNYDFMRSQFIRVRGFRDYGDMEEVYGSLERVELGGKIRKYDITGRPTPYSVGHLRTMLDMPGQQWREGCWDQRIAALIGSPRAMIVNVLSYGYNGSVRHLSKATIDAYGAHFEARYTEEQRAQELAATTRIIETIERRWPRAARTKLIFVNLINMAGFWWDRRDEVEAYYNAEAFAALEQRLRSKFDEGGRGGGLIYHRFVPVSLLLDNMTHSNLRDSNGGELIIYRAKFDYADTLKTGALDVARRLRADLYTTDWNAGSAATYLGGRSWS